MRNNSFSEMTMEMSVRDFLSQNTPITNGIAQFTPLNTTLTSSIVQWQVLAEVQVTDKRGIAQNKNLLKNSLAVMAYETGRKVCSYALSVNNLTLYNETNISDTKLKRATDNMLKEEAQLIYDRANANVAALAPFGITAALLTNLQNAINTYVTTIPKPRLGITERKQATMQIKALKVIIRDTLKKLDLLVEGMRYSQPNFYNGYKACRKTIHTGTRSIAFKANITEITTGKPLKAALLLIEHADGKTMIRKKTAEKGSCIIKSMPEGKYKVTVSDVGYEDAVTEIFVNDVEMYNLKVEMKKL